MLRMRTIRSLALLALGLMTPLAFACGKEDSGSEEEAAAPPAAVTVFAAVSTSDVLTNLAEVFMTRTGTAVRCSFASSSTLAHQIESGAPADIFLSADTVWMDHVDKLGTLEEGTRRNLLGNSLVVVAPAGRPFPMTMEPGFGFPGAFEGRLALGDPAHVPAGRYAQQALEHMNWWKALQTRLLPAMDVRDAMRIVSLGEAAAGIVYSTDAASSDGVVVIATFPESSHEPIRYPVALMGSASPGARAFLEFLTGPEAASVFEAAGFQLLDQSE